MLRRRSGFLSFTVTSLFFGAVVVIDGPKIQDENIRFALAGTAATVIVELLTHGIDTINMRSKVINGSKVYVLNFYKLGGLLSLLKGIQPVLYGYVFSSMVYFYCYLKIKT